mmetsp:Transcript_8560/g.14201  ORF Transcript_8560/g.14201 Transcript_8560/m.14201 type:complete len:205 (+) Transcript_8560:9876-10490(+)
MISVDLAGLLQVVCARLLVSYSSSGSSNGLSLHGGGSLHPFSSSLGVVEVFFGLSHRQLQSGRRGGFLGEEICHPFLELFGVETVEVGSNTLLRRGVVTQGQEHFDGSTVLAVIGLQLHSALFEDFQGVLERIKSIGFTSAIQDVDLLVGLHGGEIRISRYRGLAGHGNVAEEVGENLGLVDLLVLDVQSVNEFASLGVERILY